MPLKQRRIMRRHDDYNCLTLSEEQPHIQFNEFFVILFSSFFSAFCKANSEDPDQTPHYAVSDFGLRCLPISH